MQTTLTEALTYLISSQQRNFYARIVGSLVRIARPGLGTVGVGPSPDGKNCLYYDPQFLNRLSMPEFILTCEHEVLHLLLGHIPRYLTLLSHYTEKNAQQKYRTLSNIAADCAANELIRSANDFDARHGKWFYGSAETEGRSFLVPENYTLPRNKPYEVYHYLLEQQLNQDSKKLKERLQSSLNHTIGDLQQALAESFEQNTANAHVLWEQVVADNTINADELQGLADKIQNDARNVLSKAIEAQQKGRGTIPGHLKELIETFLAPPITPWPQILRQLCMRTRQSKLARGMSRPSRRMYGIPYILPFPGRTKDNRFTIAFALDTSGSMSQKELALGLTELLHIVRTEQDVTLTVMYCDTELHVVYDVNSVSDVDFTIKGRGGTDFNPPFKKVRQLLQTDRAPDVLIYATDGYAPEPDLENRIPIPVIWLLTPAGQIPSENYGIHLRMQDQ